MVRTGWGQGYFVGGADNDGFDDLFVTYWGQNVLYHNNGDGTFTDVTEKAGLIQPGPHIRSIVACCFLDYDLDGHLDLFVGNYVKLDPLHCSRAGRRSILQVLRCLQLLAEPQGLGGGTNILYHNRGNGAFEDISQKHPASPIITVPAEPGCVPRQLDSGGHLSDVGRRRRISITTVGGTLRCV